MNFSVLMSLYAKENPGYLILALKSIWNDQSLKPDEIILVKDGPLTEELEKVLNDFSTVCEVIKTIQLENNVGLTKALNIGLTHCKYDYVARMDTDDICRGDRFDKQIQFIQDNPGTDVVGSFAKKIDKNGKELNLLKVPILNKDIHRLIWTCPFIHPSVIFKKNKILEIGNYNPESGPRQDDYELWFRSAAAGLNFRNIPEPLIFYRFFDENFKKHNLKVATHQLMVSFKWCRKLHLGLKAYIGILVPFIRALLPYPINVYFYKLLDKVNPRNK